MAIKSLSQYVVPVEDPALVKTSKPLVPSMPLRSTVRVMGTPINNSSLNTSLSTDISPTNLTATTTFNSDKTLYITNISQDTNNQFFDVTQNNILGGVSSLNTLTGDLTLIGGTGTTISTSGSNVNINNVYEVVGSLSGATGVVVHNFATSSIFNHTSIAANFTVNVTNLGLSSGFATNVVLILNQGATPYIPNAFQIGGLAQSINWQGGSAPTGNANKKDLVSFSITNIGGTYAVFGQLVTFG